MEIGLGFLVATAAAFKSFLVAIPLPAGFVFGFVVGFAFGFGGLDFVGDGLTRGDVDAMMRIMLGGRDGRSGEKEGKTQVGK